MRRSGSQAAWRSPGDGRLSDLEGVEQGPAIEFVIPAYNASATLGDTLRSLRAQTQPAWRAWVVDDGSTDDPGAVVAALGDERVRILHRQNGGLAAARNTGYAHTAAPVVCFLDADDVVEPEFAGAMLERLGSADAAACGFRYVGPDLADLGWTYRVEPHDLATDRLAGMNPLAVGGVALRRAALERVRLAAGPFDELLPVAEDWDLWLRLDGAGVRWAVEPRTLFVCRLRGGSLSANVERMWREGLRVVRGAATDAARRCGLDAARLERRWHLRALARAIAEDDARLVATVWGVLGALGEDDAPDLAGALREAFPRRHVADAAARDACGPAWRAIAAKHLADAPEGVWGAVLRALDWSSDRWRRIAQRAAAHVPTGGTLVVYGLGQNGRAATAALRDEGVKYAVIDDHAGLRCDEPRVRVEDLTDAHAVLVTPEDRAGILARLRSARVGRVLLPEMLLAS
jgi:glycosyltransferase involved in cell wall biosynthesis